MASLMPRRRSFRYWSPSSKNRIITAPFEPSHLSFILTPNSMCGLIYRDGGHSSKPPHCRFPEAFARSNVPLCHVRSVDDEHSLLMNTSWNLFSSFDFKFMPDFLHTFLYIASFAVYSSVRWLGFIFAFQIAFEVRVLFWSFGSCLRSIIFLRRSSVSQEVLLWLMIPCWHFLGLVSQEYTVSALWYA